MNQPMPDYNRGYEGKSVQTSTEAILSLIFAVLSWLGLFGLGGIVAIILGHVAKNKIRQSAGRLEGNGLATAGLVLGYANVALTLIGFCLVAVIIGLIMMGVLSASMYYFPYFGTWTF
jgi:hypothetical protein